MTMARCGTIVDSGMIKRQATPTCDINQIGTPGNVCSTRDIVIHASLIFFVSSRGSVARISIYFSAMKCRRVNFRREKSTSCGALRGVV